MKISEAIAASGAEGIRRKFWPKDYVLKPTNSELGCVFFSKKKSAPRWEPTKEALTADDWEPVKAD